MQRAHASARVATVARLAHSSQFSVPTALSSWRWTESRRASHAHVRRRAVRADNLPACGHCAHPLLTVRVLLLAAGSFEVEHVLCQAVDSLSYIESPNSTYLDRKSCPPNTQHTHVLLEGGILRLNILQGASSIAQCTPVTGYYSPSSLTAYTWLPSGYTDEARNSTVSFKCPIGATCLGNKYPPVAQPGYSIDPSIEAGERPIFSVCPNYQSCLIFSELSETEQAEALNSFVTYGCDCLGGYTRVNLTVSSRCAAGYKEGERECTLCDTKCGTFRCEYGRSQKRCKKCRNGKLWSFAFALCTILLVFPLIELLITNAEVAVAGYEPGTNARTTPRLLVGRVDSPSALPCAKLTLSLGPVRSRPAARSRSRSR